jgi:hypothetical protein
LRVELRLQEHANCCLEHTILDCQKGLKFVPGAELHHARAGQRG